MSETVPDRPASQEQSRADVRLLLGRLMVITDESLGGPVGHVELAKRALAGGADTLQYREKRPLDPAVRKKVAESLAALCASSGRALIIDDDVDLAREVGAAGVHLGQKDLPPALARRRLKPGRIIGGTANSLEEAQKVLAAPVDYLGVGPVYGTRSKKNPAPPLTVEGLAAIVAQSPVPVYAIGGITAARVPEVLAAGAWGIAVLSAVVLADDAAAAAAELRGALDRASGDRPRASSDDPPSAVPSGFGGDA